MENNKKNEIKSNEEMQSNTRVEKITTRDGKQKDQVAFIFEYKK